MKTSSLKHFGVFTMFCLAAVALAPRATAQSPAGLVIQPYAGLTITGSVGTVYSIEYVTDLAQSNTPGAWVSLELLQLPYNPYLWVDKSLPATGQRFYRAEVFTNDTAFLTNMALIPAGSFTMGATTNMGHESYSGEVPQHSVYVSAFYMDRFEVTKALWDEVKGWNGGNGYSYDNAGSGKATNHPVHTINWYDTVKWCNARSQKEGLTPCYYTDAGLSVIYKTGQLAPYVNWSASGYRLPTEAEWEKAARGGTPGHRFAWSDSDTIQHSRANYYSSTSYAYDTSLTRGYHPTFNDGVSPYTSPVGTFAATGYAPGLYDMAGNVWEWCWDWYSSSYYGSSPTNDPRGPTSGSGRVFRGGSWGSSAGYCRAASRAYDYPDYSYYGYVGLRCVRAAGQ
jgi:formylglycine-generating enzyme required for sulfatase activity